MWYALWVSLPGGAPQFGSWLYLTAAQLNLLHRWIRADPYPCVSAVAELGFAEISLVDLGGSLAYHVPSCPPGLAA